MTNNMDFTKNEYAFSALENELNNAWTDFYNSQSDDEQLHHQKRIDELTQKLNDWRAK